MKSVTQILKPYKRKLEDRYNLPVELKVIKSFEFLWLPIPILNVVLFHYNFTKRQIKILLFIARFSIGCRRSTAHLKLSDFKEIGIYPSDIKHELEKLKSGNFIGWKRKTNNLWITQKLLRKSLTKHNEKVSEILSRNLVNHKQKLSNLPTGVNQKHRSNKNNHNR